MKSVQVESRELLMCSPHVYNFPILMSLVAHWFGRVELWKFVLIFSTAPAWRNNNKYSMFDTFKSMSYQGHSFRIFYQINKAWNQKISTKISTTNKRTNKTSSDSDMLKNTILGIRETMVWWAAQNEWKLRTTEGYSWGSVGSASDRGIVWPNLPRPKHFLKKKSQINQWLAHQMVSRNFCNYKSTILSRNWVCLFILMSC